jgi:hypothetical protein
MPTRVQAATSVSTLQQSTVNRTRGPDQRARADWPRWRDPGTPPKGRAGLEAAFWDCIKAREQFLVDLG